MNATYTLNPAHNGIEITFSGKPARAILDSLKAEGFRWHSVKRLWYAKETEKRLDLVKQITGTEAPTEAPETAKNSPKTAKAEAVNKYGVKVGDVFHMSWGWEQTNNDFFQVVKLCGTSSVRVVQVFPPFERETAYASGMAEDRVYTITGEPLQRVENSIFIADQQNGDLKKVTSFYQDNRPQIKIDGHILDRVSGKVSLYESWYA